MLHFNDIIGQDLTEEQKKQYEEWLEFGGWSAGLEASWLEALDAEVMKAIEEEEDKDS